MPGIEVGDVDVVLGLRDVVEARVVHQRRRVAHLLEPLAVAQLRGGIHRAGLHVVLEAERVADLVRGDVLDQPAHQVVGQRQLLGARVERADLDEVPVAGQVHDVVIELDVRLENLAGARVVDVRARGVLDRRGQPADRPSSARLPGSSPGSCCGVGASLARIAFLNPAASNAACQLSTPRLRYGTHLAGVAGSI